MNLNTSKILLASFSLLTLVACDSKPSVSSKPVSSKTTASKASAKPAATNNAVQPVNTRPQPIKIQDEPEMTLPEVKASEPAAPELKSELKINEYRKGQENLATITRGQEILSARLEQLKKWKDDNHVEISERLTKIVEKRRLILDNSSVVAEESKYAANIEEAVLNLSDSLERANRNEEAGDSDFIKALRLAVANQEHAVWEKEGEETGQSWEKVNELMEALAKYPSGAQIFQEARRISNAADGVVVESKAIVEKAEDFEEETKNESPLFSSNYLNSIKAANLSLNASTQSLNASTLSLNATTLGLKVTLLNGYLSMILPVAIFTARFDSYEAKKLAEGKSADSIEAKRALYYEGITKSLDIVYKARLLERSQSVIANSLLELQEMKETAEERRIAEHLIEEKVVSEANETLHRLIVQINEAPTLKLYELKDFKNHEVEAAVALAAKYQNAAETK